MKNLFQINGSKSLGSIWIENSNGKRISAMTDDADIARHIVDYLVALEESVELLS